MASQVKQIQKKGNKNKRKQNKIISNQTMRLLMDVSKNIKKISEEINELINK